MRPNFGNVPEEIGRVEIKAILQGGWLTLLKSTLRSLPIYFMSLFSVPPSITNHHLETIMRDCIGPSNMEGYT